jgi:hypothetical protein
MIFWKPRWTRREELAAGLLSPELSRSLNDSDGAGKPRLRDSFYSTAEGGCSSGGSSKAPVAEQPRDSNDQGGGVLDDLAGYLGA